MLKNIINLKNSQEINKVDQAKVNGGLVPTKIICNGVLSLTSDGTCPAGQRLIGHCICCDD